MKATYIPVYYYAASLMILPLLSPAQYNVINLGVLGVRVMNLTTPFLSQTPDPYLAKLLFQDANCNAKPSCVYNNNYHKIDLQCHNIISRFCTYSLDAITQEY